MSDKGFDVFAVGVADVVLDDNHEIGNSAPHERADLAVPRDDLSELDVKTAASEAGATGEKKASKGQMPETPVNPPVTDPNSLELAAVTQNGVQKASVRNLDAEGQRCVSKPATPPPIGSVDPNALVRFGGYLMRQADVDDILQWAEAEEAGRKNAEKSTGFGTDSAEMRVAKFERGVEMPLVDGKHEVHVKGAGWKLPSQLEVGDVTTEWGKVTAIHSKVAILTKKHNDETGKEEWALVSHKDRHVLKWFGTEKPSDEAVAKEEARVQYFKHKGNAENSMGFGTDFAEMHVAQATGTPLVTPPQSITENADDDTENEGSENDLSILDPDAKVLTASREQNSRLTQAKSKDEGLAPPYGGASLFDSIRVASEEVLASAAVPSEFLSTHGKVAPQALSGAGQPKQQKVDFGFSVASAEHARVAPQALSSEGDAKTLRVASLAMSVLHDEWHAKGFSVTAAPRSDKVFVESTTGWRGWVTKKTLTKNPGKYKTVDQHTKKPTPPGPKGQPLPGKTETTHPVDVLLNAESPKPIEVHADDLPDPLTCAPASAHLPELSTLKKGPGNSYEDEKGRKYTFAELTSPGTKYNAFLAQAGANLASMMLPPGLFIPCKAALGGEGAVGMLYPQLNAEPLKKEQLLKLTDEQNGQMMALMVTDWLLGKSTTQANHLEVDEAGNIKHTSFASGIKGLLYTQPKSKKHPGSSYLDLSPVFAYMVGGHITGDIALNFQDCLPFIEQVEKIPDEKWKQQLAIAASVMPISEEERKNLVKEGMRRKKDCRKFFEEVFSKALSKKTKGLEQQFTFDTQTVDPVSPPATSDPSLPGAMPPPDVSLPSKSLPGPADVTDAGAFTGGGTKPKRTFVDKEGNKYIFKPGELWRVTVQQVVGDLSGLICPEGEYVPCSFMNKDGKLGSLQVELPDSMGDGKKLDFQPKNLTPQQKRDVMRESVVDWVFSNHDGHKGNILLLKNGRMIGVDKEQAFRYMLEEPAKEANGLRLDYSPNTEKYSELEPFAKTMYRAYQQGQIDLDLNDTLPYIQQVENVSEAKWREAVQPYVDALGGGKGWGDAEKEAFMKRILARKDNTREDFRKLFSDIETKRTGKPTVFTFADESAPGVPKVQEQEVVQAPVVPSEVEPGKMPQVEPAQSPTLDSPTGKCPHGHTTYKSPVPDKCPSCGAPMTPLGGEEHEEEPAPKAVTPELVKGKTRIEKALPSLGDLASQVAVGLKQMGEGFTAAQLADVLKAHEMFANQVLDELFGHGLVTRWGTEPPTYDVSPHAFEMVEGAPAEVSTPEEDNTKDTTEGYEGALVSFGKTPQKGIVINGVPLEAVDAPDFASIEDKQIDEPPIPKVPGKSNSTGVIVVEDDGRCWIVEPTNHFGGYENTFPKGGQEPNLTPQQNALKELYEESGLTADITGYLTDAEGDTSTTRFYIAKRTGGAPWASGWESQAVKLMTLDEAKQALNKPRDKKVLTVLEQHLAASDKSEDVGEDTEGVNVEPDELQLAKEPVATCPDGHKTYQTPPPDYCNQCGKPMANIGLADALGIEKKFEPALQELSKQGITVNVDTLAKGLQLLKNKGPVSAGSVGEAMGVTNDLHATAIASALLVNNMLALTDDVPPKVFVPQDALLPEKPETKPIPKPEIETPEKPGAPVEAMKGKLAKAFEGIPLPEGLDLGKLAQSLETERGYIKDYGPRGEANIMGSFIEAGSDPLAGVDTESMSPDEIQAAYEKAHGHLFKALIDNGIITPVRVEPYPLPQYIIHDPTEAKPGESEPPTPEEEAIEQKFEHQPLNPAELAELAKGMKLKGPALEGLQILNSSELPMTLNDIAAQLTKAHTHAKGALSKKLEALAAQHKIQKFLAPDGTPHYFMGEMTGVESAVPEGPKQPKAEALSLHDHLVNNGVKSAVAPDLANVLQELGAGGKEFTQKEFRDMIIAEGDPAVGWYGPYANNWIKTILPKKGIVTKLPNGNYTLNEHPDEPTGQCPKGHNTFLKPAPDHCPTCGTPMAPGSEAEVSAPEPEVKAQPEAEKPPEEVAQEQAEVEQQMTGEPPEVEIVRTVKVDPKLERAVQEALKDYGITLDAQTLANALSKLDAAPDGMKYPDFAPLLGLAADGSDGQGVFVADLVNSGILKLENNTLYVGEVEREAPAEPEVIETPEPAVEVPEEAPAPKLHHWSPDQLEGIHAAFNALGILGPSSANAADMAQKVADSLFTAHQAASDYGEALDGSEVVLTLSSATGIDTKHFDLLLKFKNALVNEGILHEYTDAQGHERYVTSLVAFGEKTPEVDKPKPDVETPSGEPEVVMVAETPDHGTMDQETFDKLFGSVSKRLHLDDTEKDKLKEALAALWDSPGHIGKDEIRKHFQTALGLEDTPFGWTATVNTVDYLTQEGLLTEHMDETYSPNLTMPTGQCKNKHNTYKSPVPSTCPTCGVAMHPIEKMQPTTEGPKEAEALTPEKLEAACTEAGMGTAASFTLHKALTALKQQHGDEPVSIIDVLDFVEQETGWESGDVENVVAQLEIDGFLSSEGVDKVKGEQGVKLNFDVEQPTEKKPVPVPTDVDLMTTLKNTLPTVDDEEIYENIVKALKKIKEDYPDAPPGYSVTEGILTDYDTIALDADEVKKLVDAGIIGPDGAVLFKAKSLGEPKIYAPDPNKLSTALGAAGLADADANTAVYAVLEELKESGTNGFDSFGKLWGKIDEGLKDVQAANYDTDSVVDALVAAGYFTNVAMPDGGSKWMFNYGADTPTKYDPGTMQNELSPVLAEAVNTYGGDVLEAVQDVFAYVHDVLDGKCLASTFDIALSEKLSEVLPSDASSYSGGIATDIRATLVDKGLVDVDTQNQLVIPKTDKSPTAKCENGHNTYLAPVPTYCPTCGVNMWDAQILKAEEPAKSEKKETIEGFLAQELGPISKTIVEELKKIPEGKAFSAAELALKLNADKTFAESILDDLAEKGLIQKNFSVYYNPVFEAPEEPTEPEAPTFEPAATTPKAVVTTAAYEPYYKSNENYYNGVKGEIGNLPGIEKWEEQYPGIQDEASKMFGHFKEDYQHNNKVEAVQAKLVGMGLEDADASTFLELLKYGNLFTPAHYDPENTLSITSMSDEVTGTCPNGHQTHVHPKPKYCPSCGKAYALGAETPSFVFMPDELKTKLAGVEMSPETKKAAEALIGSVDVNLPMGLTHLKKAMEDAGLNTYKTDGNPSPLLDFKNKLVHAGILQKTPDGSVEFAPLDTKPQAGAPYSKADYHIGLIEPEIVPADTDAIESAQKKIGTGSAKTMPSKALAFVMSATEPVTLGDAYKHAAGGKALSKAAQTKMRKALQKAANMGAIQWVQADHFMFHGGWKKVPGLEDVQPSVSGVTFDQAFDKTFGEGWSISHPSAMLNIEDMITKAVDTPISQNDWHLRLKHSGIPTAKERVALTKALLANGVIQFKDGSITATQSPNTYDVESPSDAVIKAVADALTHSYGNPTFTNPHAVATAVAKRLLQAKKYKMDAQQLIAGFSEAVENELTESWKAHSVKGGIVEELVKAGVIVKTEQGIRVQGNPVKETPPEPGQMEEPDTSTEKDDSTKDLFGKLSSPTGECPVHHKTYMLPPPMYCPTCGKKMQAAAGVPENMSVYNPVVDHVGFMTFEAKPLPPKWALMDFLSTTDLTFTESQLDAAVTDLKVEFLAEPTGVDPNKLDVYAKSAAEVLAAEGIIQVNAAGKYVHGEATVLTLPGETAPTLAHWDETAQKNGEIEPYVLDPDSAQEFSHLLHESATGALQQQSASAGKVMELILKNNSNAGISLQSLALIKGCPPGYTWMLGQLVSQGFVQKIKNDNGSFSYFIGGWQKSTKGPGALKPKATTSSAHLGTANVVASLTNDPNVSEELAQAAAQKLASLGHGASFTKLEFIKGVSDQGAFSFTQALSVFKAAHAAGFIKTNPNPAYGQGMFEVAQPAIPPCSAPKGSQVPFNVKDFNDGKIVAVVEKMDAAACSKVLGTGPQASVMLSALNGMGQELFTFTQLATEYPGLAPNLPMHAEFIDDLVEGGLLQKFVYTNTEGDPVTKYFFGHWEKATDAPLKLPPESKLPTGICKHNHKTYVTPKPHNCPTCGVVMDSLDAGMVRAITAGTAGSTNAATAQMYVAQILKSNEGGPFTPQEAASAIGVGATAMMVAMTHLKNAGILTPVTTDGGTAWKIAENAAMVTTEAPKNAVAAATSSTPLGATSKPPKTPYVTAAHEAGTIKPVVTEYDLDAVADLDADQAIVIAFLAEHQKKFPATMAPMTAAMLHGAMIADGHDVEWDDLQSALEAAAVKGVLTSSTTGGMNSYLHGYWTPSSAAPAAKKPETVVTETVLPTVKSVDAIIAPHFDKAQQDFLNDYLIKNNGKTMTAIDVGQAMIDAGMSAGMAGSSMQKLIGLGLVESDGTNLTFTYPDAESNADIAGIDGVLKGVAVTEEQKEGAYKLWKGLKKLQQKTGPLTEADVKKAVQTSLGCSAVTSGEFVESLRSANMLITNAVTNEVTLLMPTAAKALVPAIESPDTTELLYKEFSPEKWDQYPPGLGAKVAKALGYVGQSKFAVSYFAAELKMSVAETTEIVDRLVEMGLLEQAGSNELGAALFQMPKSAQTPTGICPDGHKTYLVPMPHNCTVCGKVMSHDAKPGKVNLEPVAGPKPPSAELYSGILKAKFGLSDTLATVFGKKLFDLEQQGGGSVTYHDLKNAIIVATEEATGEYPQTGLPSQIIDQMVGKGVINEFAEGEYELTFGQTAKEEGPYTATDAGVTALEVQDEVAKLVESLGFKAVKWDTTKAKYNKTLTPTKIRVYPKGKKGIKKGEHIEINPDGTLTFDKLSLSLQGQLQDHVNNGVQAFYTSKIKPTIVKPVAPKPFVPEKPPLSLETTPVSTPVLTEKPSKTTVPSEFYEGAPGLETSPLELTTPIINPFQEVKETPKEAPKGPDIIKYDTSQAMAAVGSSWSEGGKGHGVAKTLEQNGPLTFDELVEKTKDNLTGTKLESWIEKAKQPGMHSSLSTILSTGQSSKAIYIVPDSSPQKYALGYIDVPDTPVATDSGWLPKTPPPDFIPSDAPAGIDTRSYGIASKLGFDLYDPKQQAAWQTSPYFELVQGLATNPRIGKSLELSGVSREALKALVDRGLILQNSLPAWNEKDFDTSTFKLATGTVALDRSDMLPPPTVVEFGANGKVKDVKASPAMKDAVKGVLAKVPGADQAKAEKMLLFMASDPGRMWLERDITSRLPTVDLHTLKSAGIISTQSNALYVKWDVVLSATADESKPVCPKCKVRHRDAHLCPKAPVKVNNAPPTSVPKPGTYTIPVGDVSTNPLQVLVADVGDDPPITQYQAKALLKKNGVGVKKGSKIAHMLDLLQNPMTLNDINLAIKDLGVKTKANSQLKQMVEAGVVVKLASGMFALKGHTAVKEKMPLPGEASGLVPEAKGQPNMGAESVRKQFAADHPIQRMSAKHAIRFAELMSYMRDRAAAQDTAPSETEIQHTGNHLSKTLSPVMRNFFKVATNNYSENSTNKSGAGLRYASFMGDTLQQLGMTSNYFFPVEAHIDGGPGGGKWKEASQYKDTLAKMGLDAANYRASEFGGRTYLCHINDPDAPVVATFSSYDNVEQMGGEHPVPMGGGSKLALLPSRAEFVLQQYALTQAMMAHHGIESMGVMRGVCSSAHNAMQQEASKRSGLGARISNRALSGWTTDINTAKSFGGGGMVYHDEAMPVHRMLVHWKQEVDGAGVLRAHSSPSYGGECEILVMGHDTVTQQPIPSAHGKVVKVATKLLPPPLPDPDIPPKFGKYVHNPDGIFYWVTNTQVQVVFIDDDTVGGEQPAPEPTPEPIDFSVADMFGETVES